MKRAQALSPSMFALAFLMLVPAARAQETPAPAQPAAAADANKPADHRDAAKDADKDAAPIPPEKSSVTYHELAIGGKTLKYTATAGTLLIRDTDDKPYGSMFYVAYTLDGAEPGTPPSELSLQRRSGFSHHLAAHGLIFSGSRLHRQPQPHLRPALQARAQPVFAPRQNRPRLCRRAPHRPLPRRRQRPAQGPDRHRS